MKLVLADTSEVLAECVADAERNRDTGPLQLVHGDNWGNVCFHNGEIVLVANLDFMGTRHRIADLALTLYYTSSSFTDDQVSSAGCSPRPIGPGIWRKPGTPVFDCRAAGDSPGNGPDRNRLHRDAHRCYRSSHSAVDFIIVCSNHSGCRCCHSQVAIVSAGMA